MNDDTIADLKQFIATTIKQETSILDEKIDAMSEKIISLDEKIGSLDKKIDHNTDQILSAIADTTNERFDLVDDDVKGLDIRVTKLESNHA